MPDTRITSGTYPAMGADIPHLRWELSMRSPLSRAVALTAAMMAVSFPSMLQAQEARGRRVGSVPREVSREAIAVFNASGTKRVRGDYVMAATDTVRGDVAVLNGRSRIGGVITGQLVIINGDVTLAQTARIDGSLTVLGGEFDSPDRPVIGGDIRVWSARLRYHEEADSLVGEPDRELFTRWTRWQRDDPDGTQSQLFLTSAHTYNRVEGLPIYLGPRVRVRNGDTRLETEVFGIFRTGTGIDWTKDNRGYRLRSELRQGKRAGAILGGRLFDEVDAVEHWQLKDSEVGLNAFLFTRDYRDYWQRHGATGYVGLFGPANTEIRASIGTERWSGRRARDVTSLFSSDVPWRANPPADEGVMHLATISAKLDTRNRADRPRSGWYLQGEIERGSGVLDRYGISSNVLRDESSNNITYTRALVDLRRYTRLGPGGQLNLRVVAGGWLSGDPLPLQRRFSVSGIDALPGFDFRQFVGTSDVGTCSSGTEALFIALGRPAYCERMALLQGEWKGDFRIDPFGKGDEFGDRRWIAGLLKADGAVVLFANTGRGWLVGPATGDTQYPKGSIPPTRTWHTDVGGGIDFGDFGVYVAQAVSQSSLSPNFYVRLGRRF